MSKICERCGVEIPDDFVNPLCWKCYDLITAKKEEPPEKPVVEKQPETKNGITELTYVERPEAEDKEQWMENIRIFQKHSKMLWGPTRSMYTFIKNYNMEKIIKHPQYPKFIWKPKIVDVGCGCGVGSNIMSQEADFVWGIDKNEKSVKFAQECFTRLKNNIYYSAQISFDVMNIFEETRELAKFDQVVAIEIIEHINDYKGFIKALLRFEKRDKSGMSLPNDPTEYFISTPNRNNKFISKHGPRNRYHVREWTIGEYYNVLDEFFSNIVFYNSVGEPIPLEEYTTSERTPILARCSVPK